MLDGTTIHVSYWDLFNTSLSKLLSDRALSFSVDIMLRELGIDSKKRVVWMHETLLLEAIFRSTQGEPDLSRFALQLPRWRRILNSRILLVPIFQSSHWSLLVLANCCNLVERVMAMSPTGPQCATRGPAQLIAVHFDTLSGCHKKAAENITYLLQKGILALWNHQHKNVPNASPPNLKAILDRGLTLFSGKVEQQTDGISCGWRTLYHATRASDKAIVIRPARLKEFATRSLKAPYAGMASRCIRNARELAKPSSTDIPSLLFPLHTLVDEEVLSYFNATHSTLSEKMISRFYSAKSSTVDTTTKRSNAVKKAQWDALRTVSERVVARMKETGLDKRRVMRNERPIPELMCAEIAKFIFHYPRGQHYAECLYYTRYNHQDSLLICSGLDLLFGQNVRIFGETIQSQSSRNPKSKSVHHQMSVIRDPVRGKTKYYHEDARFRLQLLEIHFKGIAENVVKSACKLALLSQSKTEDISDGEERAGDKPADISEPASAKKGSELQSTAKSEGKRKVGNDENFSSDSSIDVDIEDRDGPSHEWSFETSVSVHPSTETEIGKINSNVSIREIADDINACLTLADRVANEAIMTKFEEFHLRCKRKLQISNRNIKITTIENRVTPQALAKIPSLFSVEFSRLLKEGIRSQWSAELPADFFEGQLNEMIHRLLSGADKFFKRSGAIFLGITHQQDDFDDEDVLIKKGKKKSSKHDSTRNEPQTNAITASADVRNRVDQGQDQRRIVPFGLVLQTLQSPCKPFSKRRNEFFAILFHLLKNCRPHERCEAFNCGELRVEKRGTDITLCQQKLEVVRQEFLKAMDALGQSVQSLWEQEQLQTLHTHIKELKFNILRGIASAVGDTTNRTIQNQNLMYRSDIFCYELPSSYDCETHEVVQGGKFAVFHSGGQMELAIWRYEATDMKCEAIGDEESLIYRNGDNCVIGDFVVPSAHIPIMYRIQADLEVKCSFNLWDDTNYEVSGEEYLGLRRFDLVRVVLSFHTGQSRLDDCAHPLRSNYQHSMLGIVIEDPLPMKGSAPLKGHERDDGCRLRCVGPRTCKVSIVVQDDVMASSGCRVSFPEVLKRWCDKSIKHNHCYVMPVQAPSFRDEIREYVSLDVTSKLPKPFQLSLMDPTLAESFELEQQHLHYEIKTRFLNNNPFQQRSRKPFKTLENEWRRSLHEAVEKVDRDLSTEQLKVIETTLYGWCTNLVPDDKDVLESTTEPFKEFMRNSNVVPRAYLEWWGSNVCYLQGPPGSGKTRTVSVLIATVLQHMDRKPRVLVVTKTNATADDLFTKVSRILRRIFSENAEALSDAVEKMVRLGESSTNESVRKREVWRIAGSSTAVDVVDRARVVFTTSDCVDRRELQLSKEPFSLVIIEEAWLLGEESCINAVCSALARESEEDDLGEDFKRASILLVGDRSISYGSTKKTSKKVFFDRIWENTGACQLSLRISLSQQYRMPPSIAKFISSNFYAGSMTTPQEKGMKWVVDIRLRSLRMHRRVPARNVMVVDTSLEESLAQDIPSTGRSFL